MTDMNVELKTEQSTANPDDAVIMAARGDYMKDSLVGTSASEALKGAANPDKPVWTDKEKRRKFIATLLRRGHFGPFEHPQAYFAVENISRVAMAQITRHRHMSFDVQSQRYVEFGEKSPVVPPSVEESGFSARLSMHWKDSVKNYYDAIEAGVKKEDARFFLPQATPVNLSFSANPRSLMHFFDLRNSGKAQWEAREFAQQVLDECMNWSPLIFEGYQEYINHNSLRAP